MDNSRADRARDSYVSGSWRRLDIGSTGNRPTRRSVLHPIAKRRRATVASSVLRAGGVELGDDFGPPRFSEHVGGCRPCPTGTTGHRSGRIWENSHPNAAKTLKYPDSICYNAITRDMRNERQTRDAPPGSTAHDQHGTTPTTHRCSRISKGGLLMLDPPTRSTGGAGRARRLQ